MRPPRYNCTTYTYNITFISLLMNKCRRMNVICRMKEIFHICSTSILLFSNRIGTGANPNENLHPLRNPPNVTYTFTKCIKIILNRYHGNEKFKHLIQTSVYNVELNFFFLQKANKNV